MKHWVRPESSNKTVYFPFWFILNVLRGEVVNSIPETSMNRKSSRAISHFDAVCDTIFISWLHKQEESCIDGINSRLSTHGFWGIFTMCLSLLIETSFEAFQWKFNLFLKYFYLLFARIYETCVRRTLWFSHSSHWSSKCVIWMEQSPQYNKLLLQILANYFPISAKCNLMLF